MRYLQLANVLLGFLLASVFAREHARYIRAMIHFDSPELKLSTVCIITDGISNRLDELVHASNIFERKLDATSARMRRCSGSSICRMVRPITTSVMSA